MSTNHVVQIGKSQYPPLEFSLHLFAIILGRCIGHMILHHPAMRAFGSTLCLCSLVASSTNCSFEDTQSFLQTVAANRSAVAKPESTLPAEQQTIHDIQGPPNQNSAVSLAEQTPAATPAPVKTPPAKAPPPENAPKKGTPKKKGNKTAATNRTNETDDEDDQLFPPDDPNAPEPWEDICCIAGSATFATLMLCFVWLGSLWSAWSDESGASMSRIRWNFGKLSIGILLQLILLAGIRHAKHFGMAQCVISLVVTALGIAQTQWAGEPKDEGRLRWLCPAQVEGGLIFMTLAFTTFLTLNGGTEALGELAFGLALVCQVLSLMVTAVINEGFDVSNLTWATLSCHVMLPWTLSKFLAYEVYQTPLIVCAQDDLVFSMRYSMAASYSMFVFFWLLWICYWTNPGTCWRPCFLGVVLVLLTPGLSHTSGTDVFFGPWAMFGGTHEGWAPSVAGLVVIGLGALLVLAMIILSFRGFAEIKTFDFSLRGQDASLALVRILIPFWIFEHVNWGGDDSPISKWFSPQLMPGGDSPFGRILMRVNLLLLASGIYGPFFAMVTAAGFVMGCSRNSFDPDCPTQHICMLLLVLSMTPCDGCYSLTNVLRNRFPGCQKFLGDAGDSLWAKNLFRLQCSLLYFFAAEFKIQPEWLGPHGGTLIKDVHIFDLSPLRDVEHFLLPTQRVREILAHLMAVGIIIVEISLAFGFWSTRYHGHFILACAAMHLSMSLLCGQLGGFTQAGWTGLLCVGHPKLEELLEEPKNFTIAILGLVVLYSIMGDMFDLYAPPA
eukprot:s1481_g10.t1